MKKDDFWFIAAVASIVIGVNAGWSALIRILAFISGSMLTIQIVRRISDAVKEHHNHEIETD